MGWFRDFMDAGAYIMYGVDTKRARQERAERKARRSGPGPLARGIATAGIVSAVYTSGTTVPMSGETPLRDEGSRQADGERGRRGREVRGATRDQGNRTGGSGQRR